MHGTSDALGPWLLLASVREGDHIDAMALVATEAWASVGGYADIPFGWEDYDFWCVLIEQGRYGLWVVETLAEYRVHRASMAHVSTDLAENKLKLITTLHTRHSWLSIAG